MDFLDIRGVLAQIFAEELAPSGPMQAVEFIHRNHTDVYRVRTTSDTFIVHATANRKSYLEQVRTNLERIRSLEDRRIPRIAAWRAGGAGAGSSADWAMLVYRELPGRHLSRKNFTAGIWLSLCQVLEHLYALDAEGAPPAGAAARGHDPFSFPAFAQTLLLRLGELPVRLERVRAHLDRMATYVADNAAHLRVPPRLIHGDLDRSNLVVQDGSLGVLDWASLGPGDYAFDLAMLKFMLDSVAPDASARLVRSQARQLRVKFDDDGLETRLRFFLALAGLIHAFWCADDTGAFGRAWRVRAGYLHSEAQWRSPLRLEGGPAGAPAVRTEQWALDIGQPLRGLFYMLAPRRIG